MKTFEKLKTIESTDQLKADKSRGREAGIVILRVPEYYEKFSCIASRCKDSCCAGWEIDIDEDSYAYYNSVEGKFGKRLKESMYEADPDDDGGGYRFKLKGKKRRYYDKISGGKH